MSSSGSHNAHEPSSNHTPEWVWLIVWMIVVAIALQATSGTGHEGNGSVMRCASEPRRVAAQSASPILRRNAPHRGSSCSETSKGSTIIELRPGSLAS